VTVDEIADAIRRHRAEIESLRQERGTVAADPRAVASGAAAEIDGDIRALELAIAELAARL
jgi:hypothetical protein